MRERGDEGGAARRGGREQRAYQEGAAWSGGRAALRGDRGGGSCTVRGLVLILPVRLTRPDGGICCGGGGGERG